MKILIKEQLSSHKYKDSHGYLICTDCIMNRTGKQTYTRDECFGDGDNSEIEVDREAKDVFDEKTLASGENIPITIEHPSVNVDPDNYNSLAVGHMRDIHKGMYQGTPVTYGTAVITDSDAIEKVESGELVNLSCGYDCDICDDDHPKQTNIRLNHIALCQVPRAGITKIQDSKKVLNKSVKDDNLSQVSNMVAKLLKNGLTTDEMIKAIVSKYNLTPEELQEAISDGFSKRGKRDIKFSTSELKKYIQKYSKSVKDSKTSGYKTYIITIEK